MENWLQAENSQSNGLLRFLTAGSVDDGKSTLIGRLLYDSKSIFEDQLETLIDTSNGEVNLANLMDGLKAEREQGITIDVAYRYFATPKRKFIIADAPGHVQYTRNMVTAASSASLAIVLIDARKGVIEQTRRHSFIASLLRIPNIIICINKMDLVDYSQEVFEKIKDDYLNFCEKIWVGNLWFVPISALKGDQVVSRSGNLPWFEGPCLLEYLEQVPVPVSNKSLDARMPVQYVIRPRDDNYHDFRGYAGRLVSGKLAVGDEIEVLPSGKKSKIKQLFWANTEVREVESPMAVTVCIEDQLDISRGDVLSSIGAPANVLTELSANVCWMSDEPCWVNGKYLIKLGTRTVKAIVKSVDSKVDINTLVQAGGSPELRLNDIGRVSFKLSAPLVFDSFSKHQDLGSFIIIDEVNNATAGAGIISDGSITGENLESYAI